MYYKGLSATEPMNKLRYKMPSKNRYYADEGTKYGFSNMFQGKNLYITAGVLAIIIVLFLMYYFRSSLPGFGKAPAAEASYYY